MKQIVWTDMAASDLQAIYEFYLQKSADVAVLIYNQILEEADILARFPEIAAEEPLLAGMEYVFRSLVIHSGIYKIIYFVDKKNVVITHVWDCRRNPATLPKRSTFFEH
jgi:plasmid stabilization system protein ParE